MAGKKLAKIDVRFTPEEKAALQAEAEAERVSVGALVRRRTLSAQAPAANGDALPSDKTATPTIPKHRLDDLGDDPLRGGKRSARR